MGTDALATESGTSMKINDETQRTVRVTLTADEIRELIAYEMRRVAGIPVVAKNINFNIAEEHSYYEGIMQLTGASYRHTEEVKQ